MFKTIANVLARLTRRNTQAVYTYTAVRLSAQTRYDLEIMFAQIQNMTDSEQPRIRPQRPIRKMRRPDSLRRTTPAPLNLGVLKGNAQFSM